MEEVAPFKHTKTGEVVPFEQEDPELGRLVARMYSRLFMGRPTIGRHTVNIDRWANTLDIGRNDSCVCGSGKKFKKCCIDS